MNLYVELLGYAASFIILISLTMKSIVKLRWINAAGSLLFVVFAVLTCSWPTVVMNVGIIFIDVIFVMSLSRKAGDYRLVKAERGSAWLEFFYETNRTEIESIFGPDAFTDAKSFSYFVCNGEVAGLFAWKELSTTECQIVIDFVTPRFRDTKIGRYFFDRHISAFREKGYARFVYKDVGRAHWKYLEKIGFTREVEGCYSKTI